MLNTTAVCPSGGLVEPAYVLTEVVRYQLIRYQLPNAGARNVWLLYLKTAAKCCGARVRVVATFVADDCFVHQCSKHLGLLRAGWKE